MDTGKARINTRLDRLSEFNLQVAHALSRDQHIGLADGLSRMPTDSFDLRQQIMIQKVWQQPTFQPKWSRSLFARRYPWRSSEIPPYLLCSQPAPCVIYSVDNTVNSNLARDFYFVNKGPTMDILFNLIFMIATRILYITVSLALVRKVSWCNFWRSSPIPRR